MEINSFGVKLNIDDCFCIGHVFYKTVNYNEYNGSYVFETLSMYSDVVTFDFADNYLVSEISCKIKNAQSKGLFKIIDYKSYEEVKKKYQDLKEKFKVVHDNSKHFIK